MRTGRTLEVVHINHVIKGGTFVTEPVPPHHPHHMPPESYTAATGWKSPVPYLFGGLAAMLGLIAFALLILACSYWKLSGYLDSGENSGDDPGDGDEKVKEGVTKVVFPNSIFVIMAGEEKPTFLATPATSRKTSFGDTASCSCSSGGGSGSDEEERRDNMVELTTVMGTTTTINGSRGEEEKS